MKFSASASTRSALQAQMGPFLIDIQKHFKAFKSNLYQISPHFMSFPALSRPTWRPPSAFAAP